MKFEKIILLLLTSVCFLVGMVLVGIIVDPNVVLDYVYASSGEEGDLYEIEPVSSRSEDQNHHEDWSEFRSEEYGFRIQYPESVSSKTVINRHGLNAGIGTETDTPVWQFTLDEPQYFQRTNLVEGSLVINVAHNPDAVVTCSQFKQGSLIKAKQGEKKNPPIVDINGIAFYKDEVIEGAMGEQYEKISYRTIHENACYQITILLHSQNIDAFVTGEFEAFPREEIVQKLFSVASTFQFLGVIPTFPKQPLPSQPDLVTKSIDRAPDGYVDGIDVSHWQGDINWNKVEGAGYKFAFAKATEGVGFTDWEFFTNTEEGTSAGVLMGAYHYARPDLNNTGAEEAEWFLSVVGDYIEAGYLRPVLDLEVKGNLSREEISAWTVEWMETVKEETGVEPLIYTYYYFILEKFNDSVKNYDLWIAYWNCDPTPTHDIPPTGGFADWDFWQYQAPGGCGYYSIPGISGSVDLDIFNGIEEELVAFESDAPLWVSLANYSYRAPAPHYADLIADVNGSATGPMDIAFWWDCNELGNDINNVMNVCGRLPMPEEGKCEKNGSGMKCNAVENENQMAEHTYVEIGDYTPKVIVKRGGEVPAEDRYLINVINPIRSIDVEPESPAEFLINRPNQLSVSVKIDSSVEGALQVELLEDGLETLKDQSCKPVAHDQNATKTFDLEISESEMAMKSYTIWARYQPFKECPLNDVSPDDQSKSYQIIWGLPEIDVLGNGLSIENGQISPSQLNGTDFGKSYVGSGKINRKFSIGNDGTIDLQLSGFPIVSISGPHADEFEVNIQPPNIINEGEEAEFGIVFDPEADGLRTATVSIENNDDDENPYSFGIQGTGSQYPIYTPADFHGNDVTNLSVFKKVSSDGVWFIEDRPVSHWGNEFSIPVPGDYDGDGLTDIAVYNDGTWYVKDQFVDVWGDKDSVPVPGDYDGDGDTDLAVVKYQPWGCVWYIKGQSTFSWGSSDSIPIPRDYDGNGTIDPAVFDDGIWYVKEQFSDTWGEENSIPVPGDYNGDGKAELAVYKVEPWGGVWFIKGLATYEWGNETSVPVPGDYDGDGTIDPAVYDNGTWYVMDQFVRDWGDNSSYPLPAQDTNGDGDPYQ